MRFGLYIGDMRFGLDYTMEKYENIAKMTICYSVVGSKISPCQENEFIHQTKCKQKIIEPGMFLLLVLKLISLQTIYSWTDSTISIHFDGIIYCGTA